MAWLLEESRFVDCEPNAALAPHHRRTYSVVGAVLKGPKTLASRGAHIALWSRLKVRIEE